MSGKATSLVRYSLVFTFLFLALCYSASFAYELKIPLFGKKANSDKKTDQNKEPNKDQSKEQASGKEQVSDAKNPSAGQVTRVFGEGVTGPDVIGLRIGMSPAAVKAIFKAHNLINDGFREDFETLVISGLADGGVTKEVPNGKYLDEMFGAYEKDDFREYVSVHFTPTPGRERVMLVTRTINNPKNQMPTFGACEKALVEKYGPFTYHDPKHPPYVWIYESNGTLRKPGPMPYRSGCFHRDVLSLEREWSLLWLKYMEDIEKTDRRMAPCGGINISIIIQGDLNKSEAFIPYYEVTLLSFDELFGSAMATRAMLDELGEKERKAAVKKGVKPDL